MTVPNNVYVLFKKMSNLCSLRGVAVHLTELTQLISGLMSFLVSGLVIWLATEVMSWPVS